MKKSNSLRITKSFGLKLKPKLAMFVSALNTWLQHVQRSRTDAEMKTESTSSLIFTKEKRSKQTTSTHSKKKCLTSTKRKCHILKPPKKTTPPAHSHSLKLKSPKSKTSWKQCKLSCDKNITQERKEEIIVTIQKEKAEKKKKKKSTLLPTPHNC